MRKTYEKTSFGLIISGRGFIKYIIICIAVLWTILTLNAETTDAKRESNVDVFTKSNPVLIELPRNRIVPGDSSEDRRLQREREAERREVQAREIKRSSPSFATSYTGYGQAVRLYQDKTNNCVVWAKRQTGITRQIGYAGWARTQGTTPQVGSIALEWNHASVVVAINESSIIVHESNYLKGWIDERVIPISKIRGFIYD